jgi:p-hydroxybenzoate 3-monooxygenase
VDVPERTRVAIVGAGPAGLVLSHLLHLEGIESVVLEMHEREYVERRVRAGVLEQGTVVLLGEMGVGDRLKREGLVHAGVELRFGGERHRIAFDELTGKAITIYGQQEVVKDLIAARLQTGGCVLFGAEAVAVDPAAPSVRYRCAGALRELRCDFIAGCDGFHGPSRSNIPEGVLAISEHTYPIGWLGILAAVPPSTEELIYCRHERGFALHSMRSHAISRLYLQCEPDEDIDAWPDDRIWDELGTRFETGDGWTLHDGPVLEKNVVSMHSFVAGPMQHDRLFLAGDSAHIVPATGAKGLNLAVADSRALAEGLVAWYRRGDDSLLSGYSSACLPRVWRAQRFASWMTSLFHRPVPYDGFVARLQLAELEYLCGSRAASTTLAENYVGL